MCMASCVAYVSQDGNRRSSGSISSGSSKQQQPQRCQRSVTFSSANGRQVSACVSLLPLSPSVAPPPLHPLHPSPFGVRPVSDGLSVCLSAFTPFVLVILISSRLVSSCPPARVGAGLPRGLHGQLEPFPADGRQRPGGGILGGGRQALLLQVSRGGVGLPSSRAFAADCPGSVATSSLAFFFAQATQALHTHTPPPAPLHSPTVPLRYMVAGGEEGEHLSVATTRPETILGDTAVCVHPEVSANAQYAAVHVVLLLEGGGARGGEGRCACGRSRFQGGGSGASWR